MNRRGASIAISFGFLFAGALTACGGEDVRFGDKQIIERLNLKESEGDYAVDGDTFCEVDKKLLNSRDEAEAAADKDDLGLVVTSRNANVGVLGLPPFTPDCAAAVKKKLNKLDPPEK
jgi:hypothetical protein